MGFCGSCGKKVDPEDKFCTSCGKPIKKEADNVTQKVEKPDKENGGKIIAALECLKSDVDQNQESESKPSLTIKLLEKDIVDTVEKILIAQGYEVKSRQRIIGKSGSYNEIDIIFSNKEFEFVAECKSYSDDKKVGVKEIREFIEKLDDLGSDIGMFATSSYFTDGARDLSEVNQQGKKLFLMDHDDLVKTIMFLAYKKDTKSEPPDKTISIENSLPLTTTISDESILHLKNRDRVTIQNRQLIFVPIYVTSYDLDESFRAPDKNTHYHRNEGTYYTDGIANNILYGQSRSGKKYSAVTDKGKHMISDLQGFKPRMVKVVENECVIVKREPRGNIENIEFKVRNQVSKDNEKTIRYNVKVGKDKFEYKEYHHTPKKRSIECQTIMVFIPMLHIEFRTGDYVYKRTVLMASGIVTQDEIAVCKHLLGKKTTFAVCDVCGIAKCEKDVVLGYNDDYYCKNHAPKELKGSSRSASISKKLRKFRREKEPKDDSQKTSISKKLRKFRREKEPKDDSQKTSISKKLRKFRREKEPKDDSQKTSISKKLRKFRRR